jgi:sugar phosphate isomerase/epimerase
LAKITISNLPYIDGNSDEIIEFLDRGLGVEFFIEPLVEGYENGIENLLDGISKKNLSFHCPYKLVNEAVNKNSVIWERTLNAFKYAMELCKKYKGEYMVIHTNEAIWDKTEDEEYVRENLYTLLKLAEEYEITAAVENVGIGPNNIFTMDKYIDLFKEYKNVKALIDVGHAFANAWNVEKLVYELKDKIIAYHIHDNYGSSDLHLPIGKGKFNWHKFFKIYNKYTPEASLVLEYRTGTTKNNIENGIRYIERNTCFQII